MPGSEVKGSIIQTRKEYNEYQRVYQLRRYHSRRDEALDILGGICVVCGSTDDLEIDHIDWAKKSIDIGRLWSVSYRRFLEELSKCQLLCHRHHKEKTLRENLVRRPITHGKYHAAYHKHCTCDACKEFKREYNAKQRTSRKR